MTRVVITKSETGNKSDNDWSTCGTFFEKERASASLVIRVRHLCILIVVQYCTYVYLLVLLEGPPGTSRFGARQLYFIPGIVVTKIRCELFKW